MSKRLDDLTREMEKMEKFCIGAGELHPDEVTPFYPNGLASILRLSGGLLYPIGKESAKGNARLFAQLMLTILQDMRKDPQYGLEVVPDHCLEAASTILTLTAHVASVPDKLVCYLLHQIGNLTNMWAWKTEYAPEPHRMGLVVESLARHALALAWHRDPEAVSEHKEV